MGFFDWFFGVDTTSEPEDDKHKFSLKNIKNGLYTKLFIDKDRMHALKSISKELEDDIRKLKEHIENFNSKMVLVQQFMQSKDLNDLRAIKTEVAKIRRLLDIEYKEDTTEDTYAIKILRSIDNVIDNETNQRIADEEDKIRREIRELKEDIEKLQPCLIRQVRFFRMPIDQQMSHIKDLLFDIQEEAAVIGYEQSLTFALKNEIEAFEVAALMSEEK